MREKKSKRIKSDGSRIIRLPRKKISGSLGIVAVLLCLAFPIPTVAKETLHTEETTSVNETEEDKAVLTYESPIFTDGGERFVPEETKIENGMEYRLVSLPSRSYGIVTCA